MKRAAPADLFAGRHEPRLVCCWLLRFNRRVSPAVHALAGLVAVLRNENLRRLELAWGAAITAEWAHFVALGVFAYDAGGTVGVGIAGLVRMLPAALVAPFAASLGDRVPTHSLSSLVPGRECRQRVFPDIVEGRAHR
jgi:hypothetical protein